jgi:leucyl-tRNA synthetase
MHLLYFRFWTKAMQKLGMVNVKEPVKRLITQGMVNAPAYSCPKHKWVPAASVRDLPAEAQVCPQCQTKLEMSIVKMSKSKYNGIDPMELIERYGADTTRLYTLFAAPPEKDLVWNADDVEGIYRFVGRLWRLAAAQRERTRGVAPATRMAGLTGADAKVRQAVHRTLVKVTDEIGTRNHFNTAIAAMMELCNTMHEHNLHCDDKADVSPAVAREAMLTLAMMLAPLAPHLAEQLWSDFGGEGLVAVARWPKPDPEAVALQTLTIAVQVNGKLRGQIEIPAAAEQAEALALAKADEKIAKHLEGKTIKKEVYVQKRLVNFVVA